MAGARAVTHTIPVRTHTDMEAHSQDAEGKDVSRFTRAECGRTTELGAAINVGD